MLFLILRGLLALRNQRLHFRCFLCVLPFRFCLHIFVLDKILWSVSVPFLFLLAILSFCVPLFNLSNLFYEPVLILTLFWQVPFSSWYHWPNIIKWFLFTDLIFLSWVFLGSYNFRDINKGLYWYYFVRTLVI
jgi:hypothetical protein